MSQLTLSLQQLNQVEHKPFRWITQEEQKKFVAFLSAVGIHEYAENLTCCANTWKKFQCANDHSHSRKVVYNSCGKRGKCPRDSMAYASKRAELMYQWIKRNIADKMFYDFDLKMNQIVLTLPKELHSNITNKGFAKMIKAFMLKRKIEAWGYVIQDWHSKDPLSERYVHAHILSLNIKQEGSRLVENDYWIDVEQARKDWKQIINGFENIEMEGNVNIHTEYHSVLDEKDKVKHMLEYVYRYPVEDLFKVQVRYETVNYVQVPQIEKNNEPKLKLYFCLSCGEHVPSTDREKLEHCRYLRHDIE